MVHDRLEASRFPYRVQGHAMCPVHWSLKRQWTAQPLPVADILCRVGISVCVVVTTSASKAMRLAMPKSPAPMTALAGIRRRNLLNRHTSQMGFVSDELFQLEEWPIVPVLPGIRFRALALTAPLADASQVFETDAGMTPSCQRHYVFGEAVVDMRHHAPFPAFKLLDGPMFPRRLQLLAACSIDATDMADVLRFPEDDRAIRRCRSQRDIPTSAWSAVSPEAISWS